VSPLLASELLAQPETVSTDTILVANAANVDIHLYESSRARFKFASVLPRPLSNVVEDYFEEQPARQLSRTGTSFNVYQSEHQDLRLFKKSAAVLDKLRATCLSEPACGERVVVAA
jgi:hypothetical protein